jgi:hypothetical protein
LSAWRRFGERVAAAEAHVLGGADSPRAEADAREYVAGLARVALAQHLDGSDPHAPRFVENPSPTSKWGAENADNRYLWAPLHPDRRYRVRGRRGTSFELLFEVKEGFMQQGAARNFAARTASDLTIDAEGGFTLWLGGAERGANQLAIDPEARWLLVREYFADWEREEPASLAIECIDDQPARDPAPVDARIDAAGAWVEATARCWTEWVAELRGAHVPGQLAPARRYAGGADDILYGNDWFRLGDDEAMIVECALPDARYWAFQLVDPCFRSLDWARHQTSLNHTQARAGADGRVRIVVAHRDPGVASWLDTTGLREGVFQYRFVWARNAPQPSARIVPFGRVAELLPPSTPRIDPAGRAAALARRSRHAARRGRHDRV